MLHVECHGNEDGFQFADGSSADWVELKKPITDLNVATGLNLMITVAACTGGALAKVVSINDRAPFWGLIGPTKILTAGDLEKAYRALYLTLLSAKSPAKAVEAMDAVTTPGSFWRTTAQDIFEKVWANYRKEHCSPEVLDVRAERMKAQLQQLLSGTPPSTEKIKSDLVDYEPKAFERYRDTYFMCDIVPEHVARFPVEYVA
ncbi:MAG: hypothetical protein ACXWTP_08775 [Methylosarcina sp.]